MGSSTCVGGAERGVRWLAAEADEEDDETDEEDEETEVSALLGSRRRTKEEGSERW